MRENGSFLNDISRNLMKRLRLLMGEKMPPLERLNRLVEIVAKELRVDVCSCYLLQANETLELFASYGLKKEAVRKTKLNLEEGIIGEIAFQKKPIAVSDVWEDPFFSYRPETGEDDFKSLMGVPLLKETRLLGVLAVQTKANYLYSEEETELMENTAMIVSEFIASNEETFFTLKAQGPADDRIEARRLNAGLAIGQVFIHRQARADGKLFATDPLKEIQAFHQALHTLQDDFEKLAASADATQEQKTILQTYQMFLKDKGWMQKIIEAIRSGLTACASVQRAGDEFCERMRRLNDDYLRERSYDFQDLTQQLLGRLSGEDWEQRNKELPEKAILAASFLGPAELLSYDKSKIKALVLENGSPTMHVAIVARSYNLPILAEIENVATRLTPGETVIVDADNELLYLHPTSDKIKEFQATLDKRERLLKEYAKLKGKPCISKDGVKVQLNMNAGLASDIFALADGMAEEIGLYRTELPFMSAEQLPNVASQIEIYKKALKNAEGKPITFRTLDIGSDKVLPYVSHREEANPSMGWRSIRLTLDRRAILRQQLRAFIRAVDGGVLKVMFPMVSTVEEFKQAKQTLEIELQREKEKGGKLPSTIQVGTMVEVPSLLCQLDALLPLTDFISVGSNDLSQFLFAIDRSDPMIWERYDVLSPAMLKTLKFISDKADSYNVSCCLCGEMASRPLEAMALIALGFRKLSMNIAALGAVKAMILSLNVKEAAEYLNSQLNQSAPSLRERLRFFALDHNIVIS